MIACRESHGVPGSVHTQVQSPPHLHWPGEGAEDAAPPSPPQGGTPGAAWSGFVCPVIGSQLSRRGGGGGVDHPERLGKWRLLIRSHCLCPSSVTVEADA